MARLCSIALPVAVCVVVFLSVASSVTDVTVVYLGPKYFCDVIDRYIGIFGTYHGPSHDHAPVQCCGVRNKPDVKCMRPIN